MQKNILCTLVFLLFCGCSYGSDGGNNYELLSKEAIACAPPAQMEVQPWGEAGLSRSCSIKNGPFVTAESGYIRLRGQYDAGKKAGIWRWYNKQGNVVKEIDYSVP